MFPRALLLGALVLVASASLTAALVWQAARATTGGLPGDVVALALVSGLVQAGALSWLTWTRVARHARQHDDPEVTHVSDPEREAGPCVPPADAALSEEHLQLCGQVVSQLEQVIFQLDHDGRWTFLNRAWEALTGYDRATTLGRALIGFVHPDDRQAVDQAYAALLSREKDKCHLVVRFLAREGECCWTSVDARPVLQGDRLVGFAGTIIDVTERRQIQQALERARFEAERASAAKNEFLKSMSHEMRTPLNGVLGLLELLSMTPLDQQQGRYVAVARASATHLTGLISDILDLSRIEGDGLVLERTLFDLPDLVESSVDAVAAAAAAKRLRISCTVTQHVPTWVIGDPGRLRQVLVNLLANAVKFTERGGVHVQCDADVDLRTRRATVRIEVHDTGVGIPEDQIDRLFLPFTTGDASSTRRHSGSGLGLTICKRLVDAMNGTIAVRNTAPAGTAFTITLPIDVADAAMVESERDTAAPPRVLAVLPDPGDRETTGRLFESWRLDASFVDECDAAFGHLQASSASRLRFGVALIDSTARGAADLSRRLRELSPPPAVVWVMPQDGRVPPEISGVREQIARPITGPLLFDALMQAMVGATQTGPPATRPQEWARALKVLVAEDHDVNQMVVRELLQGIGCTVDVAGNGEEAVAAVLGGRYDVVLMDCQMPVLDGLEATRRIRRAHRESRAAHVPAIIALTANATNEDRQACLEAGMDAYLTKPVRGPVLQRTLQRLVTGDAGVPIAPAPPDVPRTARHPMPPLGSAPVADLGPLADTPEADDILDPEEVLLRCNRNADLGARMLQLFAESLPADLEQLENAAAANDRRELAAIAHKIRGAAATLAAVRLAGALTGVELFLKHGDGGPLADLLADVRHESALFLGAAPHVVRRLATTSAQVR